MNTSEEIGNRTEDITIIHEIEQQLSISIPEATVIRSGKSGFKTFHNHVIELSIISANAQKVLEKIFSLRHLEKLTLNETEIQEIPDSISNLTKLTHLSLKQNLLVSAPEGLLDLPKLSHLSLSNNKFESFITKEGQLSLLKTLELENNNLTKVNFVENSGFLIENLFISNNKIEELNVEYLVNLRYLSAQYNNLKVIPNVTSMSKLNTLELDFNAIEEFTIDLKNLSSLVNFSISYNRITDIDFKNEDVKEIAYFFFDGNPLGKESKKHLKQYIKVKGMNSTNFFY